MSARILHVLDSGRVENTAQARIVRDLVTASAKARFDWHCCFLRGDGPLSAQLQAAGATIHHLPWSGNRGDPAGALHFYRFLRNGRFDLLAQHFGNNLVRALARLARVPAPVYHAHSRVLENAEPGRLISSNVRFAAAVIANSRATAAGFRCAGPVHVIYPGVSIPPVAAPPLHLSSSITVGAIARLVPLKGLQYLIEAIHLLRERQIHLEIAGTGPEESSLRDTARRLGLAGRVRFLGWVDPSIVLPRWHVFSLPSLEEAFGIAALEAMAAGLPVIASDVGGLPELVTDGETGFLIPPKSPALLASRIEQLFDDPALRVRMGFAARTRARQNFSVARMVEQITKLYTDLLSAKCISSSVDRA